MRVIILPALIWLGLLSLARADVFVRDDIQTDPEPWRMTVCHGNGCVQLSHVGLTPQQWRELTALFHPLAQQPEHEREMMRAAIARMEQLAGDASATWQDKGGTFNGGDGQMDCIDESINTTLYLTLFQKYGLVRLHRVEDRATRGWFIFGWPHTTAVVSEIGDGKLWAVDSWFLDNGKLPFIIPLEIWKSGWSPEGW